VLARLWLTLWILLCITAFALPVPAGAQDSSPVAVLLTIDGPVTPAMAEYLSRGIHAAEKEGAEVLIFQLDTPGGSVELMNDIVKGIRASSVPVVVYIAPRGAIAGSAGTVVTLAGHAAAMAPETAIGAASPVGAEGEDLGETLEEKTKNILKATVRSLAEGRGIDAVALAEATIESAEAVSANEALESGLVDFVASDVGDLLDQLDGFAVETISGEQVLDTDNAIVVPFEQSFIERLLGVLTNPNIVFLLIAVGVQAILIEISSPGGWVAGFIGVVCLALAVYGLGVLPVNWFGIVFLITAFVLFILDIKAPTHGALTAAGVVSLIIGALVLFNSPSVPNFQRVSVPLIIGSSIVIGGIFFVIMIFAIRAQASPVLTGMESLIGKQGVARSDIFQSGLVQLGGEQWSAELDTDGSPVGRSDRVQVVRVEGNKLIVRKVEDQEKEEI
jgi:membrane-bound serine protease (ClpP class)